jgi:hypothetical protein
MMIRLMDAGFRSSLGAKDLSFCLPQCYSLKPESENVLVNWGRYVKRRRCAHCSKQETARNRFHACSRCRKLVFCSTGVCSCHLGCSSPPHSCTFCRLFARQLAHAQGGVQGARSRRDGD